MNTDTVSRREWLRASARWAVLGGLGLLTGGLVARRSVASGCTVAPDCRVCRRRRGCWFRKSTEYRRLCRLSTGDAAPLRPALPQHAAPSEAST